MSKSVLRFGSFVIAASLLFSGGCAQLQEVGAYKTGTEVPQTVMDTFVDGKTKQSEVIAKIGQPNDKSTSGKTEIWKYNFSKIRHIGASVNETAVFEWTSRGVLKAHYKTNGGGSSSGNALLAAAGH
jgi:hypothetical protein